MFRSLLTSLAVKFSNFKDENQLMTFELLCNVDRGCFFGAWICFGGYRLFPGAAHLGLFFGFGLGAQSVQLLFEKRSWLRLPVVVGFVVAILFAVLSLSLFTFSPWPLSPDRWVMAWKSPYHRHLSQRQFEPDCLAGGMALAIVMIVITLRFNLANM
ncbi:MAG: hypothetical protein H6661_08525 [Ardenticatenaceae bacterium]|nr:hypothetical protein [Ardenticatenaceae bacterium]